jgi:hypothetical protein
MKNTPEMNSLDVTQMLYAVTPGDQAYLVASLAEAARGIVSLGVV